MKAERGIHFFGGVHPHDKKSLSAGMPTEIMPLPEVVAISTSQSLGKPAVPVVTVGQEVKLGELIAKADGAISSNVFASVCGTVEAIRDEVGSGGTVEKYIFIKNNGKTDTAFLPPLESPTRDEIKERIKEAGIVGLGGAGFPTGVKVNPATPVDALVINGAECEPYLTCDYRLMLEKTEKIVRGARYLARALGASDIYIGIEANKPAAIAKFEPYEDIEVIVLAKKYPAGAEKQLIHVVLDRKVGLGKLPADSGVVVQNVATALAVYEAVELGKPLFERVLTVSGEAVTTPKNVKVRLGTKVEEIIKYCGGDGTEGTIGVYGIDVAFEDTAKYRNSTLNIADVCNANRIEEGSFGAKQVKVSLPVINYASRANTAADGEEGAQTNETAAAPDTSFSATGICPYTKKSPKAMIKGIQINIPAPCTVNVFVSGKRSTCQTANFFGILKTRRVRLSRFKNNINPERKRKDNSIYVVSYTFKKPGRYYFGVDAPKPKKVILGGPMTGVAQTSYDTYTHKTTSGILLLSEREAAMYEPTPCIGCGKCADACPMRLMPMHTEFYSESGDYEAAAKYGGTLACIECGACEYICPAKRPLIQAIRRTKAELRKKK